jgi:hypothetical protein
MIAILAPVVGRGFFIGKYVEKCTLATSSIQKEVFMAVGR